MLNQHWVEIMLYRIGRMFAAMRPNQDAATLLAVLAIAAAAVVAHYAPAREAEGAEAGDLAELSEPSQHGHGGLAAASASAHGAAGPGVRRFALSREQQNVAQFIAGRYQVALEQTQEFVEYAYRTARDTKLDPLLILAVISVESSFDPSAQSNRGAQGLMQVLTRVHADKFAPFGGVTAAFDPLANMRVGAQILKSYLTRDGSVEGALKSYAGAALLPHDGGYGAKVLTERERIAVAASGGRPELVDRPAPAPERAKPAPAAPEAMRREPAPEPVAQPAQSAAASQASSGPSSTSSEL